MKIVIESPGELSENDYEETLCVWNWMNCHCKLTWTGLVHDCTFVVICIYYQHCMHSILAILAIFSLKWWERLSTGEGQLAFKGEGANAHHPFCQSTLFLKESRIRDTVTPPSPKWNPDSKIATKLGSFNLNNKVCFCAMQPKIAISVHMLLKAHLKSKLPKWVWVFVWI